MIWPFKKKTMCLFALRDAPPKCHGFPLDIPMKFNGVIVDENEHEYEVRYTRYGYIWVPKNRVELL